jgi:hypothetical protein
MSSYCSHKNCSDNWGSYIYDFVRDSQYHATIYHKILKFYPFLFLRVRIILSGVRLSPLGTAATIGLLYQPQIIDNGDCGAIGGIKIGRGNRNTKRKPALVPLCPPQIPHNLTRARTRVAEMGSQRLTAWAMTRPLILSYLLRRNCVLF